MTDIPNPRFVTAKELAAIISVAYITIKRWKRDLIIVPQVGINKVQRCNVDDAIRSIAEHTLRQKEARMSHARPTTKSISKEDGITQLTANASSEINADNESNT